MAQGDISFTYGGYSPDRPVDTYQFSEDDTSLSFSMSFLVLVNNVDELEEKVEEALTALRQWNNKLTIIRGGVATHYAHADNDSDAPNSGFLGRPQVTKAGGPLDGGLSQRLTFSITLGRPVKAAGGTGGRRVGNQRISRQNPSGLYQFNITAEYTATEDGNSAQENILAGFQTYADALVADLAGDLSVAVYEIIDRMSWQVDDQDKRGTASITYREVETDESAVGEDTDLVMVDFTFGCSPLPIGHKILNPNGLVLSAVPPLRFNASYTAFVAADSLESAQAKYMSAVESFLLASIQERCGISSGRHSVIIVQNRMPSFSDQRNQFSVSWSGLVLGSQKVVSYSERFSQNDNPHVTYRKIRDGKNDTFAIWALGRELTANHNVIVTQYDSVPPDLPKLGGPWVFLGANFDLGPYESDGILESGGAGRSVRYGKVKYTKVFSNRYLYAKAGSSPPTGPITGPPI